MCEHVLSGLGAGMRAVGSLMLAMVVAASLPAAGAPPGDNRDATAVSGRWIAAVRDQRVDEHQELRAAAVDTTAAPRRTAVTVGDIVGDVPTARGDMTRTRIRYRDPFITLSARVRRLGKTTSPSWRDGDTALVWLLSSNRRSEDYVAVLFNDGRDRLVAEVLAPSGERVCHGAAKRRRNTLSLRIHRACVLDAERLAYSVGMLYDLDPRSPSDDSMTVDVSPDSTAWSPVAQRPLLKTVLTAEVIPRVPTYGEDFVVRAKLTPRYGGDIGERTIRRAWRREGSAEWFTLDELTTTHETVEFTRRAEVPEEYRIHFDGLPDWTSSRSRILRFPIAKSLYASHQPADVGVGHATRVAGRVEPYGGDDLVDLQERIGGTWTTVETYPVRDDGFFAFDIVATASGTFTYRIKSRAADGYVAGVSDDFDLVVYDATITAVEPSDPERELRDLNSEFITVLNSGVVPLNLYYWQPQANLADGVWRLARDDTHLLLAPGESIQVHTGSGEHRPGHAYLQRPAPLWPAAGVARLYDDNDDLISELVYGVGGTQRG